LDTPQVNGPGNFQQRTQLRISRKLFDRMLWPVRCGGLGPNWDLVH
jgi:hypothetical protein